VHVHACTPMWEWESYMQEKNKIAYIGNISKKGTTVLGFKQGDYKWV